MDANHEVKKTYWFKRSENGVFATPTSWKGYVLHALFLAGWFGFSFYSRRQSEPDPFTGAIPYILIWVWGMIFFTKTEKRKN